MKKVKAQLKVLSKNLVSLSKQVDKISKQVDKMQPATKTTAKRKPAAKRTKAAAPKRVVKRTRVAATKPRAARGSTVLDSVFNTIKRSKRGVSIAQLKAKTGLNPRQLSNALYKLSKKGTIVAKTRGLYVKK
jgi:predicted Rossmann fold nucleotide-binding protein DprA/Smf involved in DNA uptake